MPDLPDIEPHTNDDSRENETSVVQATPKQRGPRWGCWTVVVVTIGWLVWLFATKVPEARMAARCSTDKSNLKVIGLALHNYHDKYGCLPPVYVADADGRPMHSWRMLILPFIDEMRVYEQYDFSQPWNSPHNRALELQMPRPFAIHGEYEPGSTATNFVAVVGPETVWPGATPRNFAEITDDLASTIAVVQSLDNRVHWMEPRDASFSNINFEVGHPAGISAANWEPHVLTMDGRVHTLPKDLPPEALRVMLKANSGKFVKERDGRWIVKENHY